MSVDVERTFHLSVRPHRRGTTRRITVQAGADPQPPITPPTQSPVRPHPLARRMALAIEAKRLIDRGVVADAAAMARIAGLTRARMTQILNLTLLAPDLQEEFLWLTSRDRIPARLPDRLSAERSWARQRERWVRERRG